MPGTFQEIFTAAVRHATLAPRKTEPRECVSLYGKRCVLCHAGSLTYEDELALKNRALQEFWRTAVRAGALEPLVPSPRGRAYRVVTKRRAFPSRHGIKLGLIGTNEEGFFDAFEVDRCAIEPREHAALYESVRLFLDHPASAPLVRALRYVIIKGNYREQMVIFTVDSLTPAVMRAANSLSRALTKTHGTVAGLFLYEDRSDGTHYLGDAEKTARQNFRKLYGKSEVYQKVHGMSFFSHPLSFTQVNESLLAGMVTGAAEMLRPEPRDVLFDLYAGYGLFALSLASKVKRATGIEISNSSVQSAVANGRRQKAANVRFIRSDITSETVIRFMGNVPESLVLLDPPRSGTGAEVVESIASCSPKRVVHLFCNVDIIAADIRRWQKSGYQVQRVLPMDNFPGTSSVEIMVLLVPES